MNEICSCGCEWTGVRDGEACGTREVDKVSSTDSPDNPVQQLLASLHERAKELSCLYRVDEILEVVDAVMVAGCPPNSCHHLWGNFVADKRIELARILMGQLGLDSTRLRFEYIGAPDAERVVEELARFQRVSLFRIAVADIGREGAFVGDAADRLAVRVVVAVGEVEPRHVHARLHQRADAVLAILTGLGPEWGEEKIILRGQLVGPRAVVGGVAQDVVDRAHQVTGALVVRIAGTDECDKGLATGLAKRPWRNSST